jgi:subtilisin-like proprotein convertase family protein
MKNKLLFSIALLVVFFSGFSQNIWNKTSDERLSTLSKFDRATVPTEYSLYSLDLNAFKSMLQNAPNDQSGITSNVVVPFPNSNGVIENFIVYDAPVMEEGLALKFPEIKSYIAKGVTNPKTTLRFSVTNFGLHVMSVTSELGTYYIDTYTKDLNNYIVYNRKNIVSTRSFSCHTDESELSLDHGRISTDETMINDGNFRQYRIAIACTVEYAAFHLAAAGTPAITPLAQKKAVVLSAMVVSMTRLNGVYEREMSLRMNLVANNDLIIFITSDNFTNSPAMLNEIQTVVDGAIGSANYDMGHGFCTTDSGIAQLSSVCNNAGLNSNGKARGITGQPSPVGDPFDIDYTAHEMGHQWGASHTQNNPCNSSADSAYETGSASTIMGYAGICAPNVQSNSNDYFHARSILQMSAFVLGNGGSCAAITANGNVAPVVQAGADFTIPRGTAFILKGAATDSNGDALTYCWEQYNNQITTQPPLDTYTTGPNFRSVSPTTSPNRYMPRFEDVLQGNLTPTWEVVPNVARTLNFALTVRDNRAGGGMTNRDDMVVNVSSVGPFRVTNPDVENTSWSPESTQTLTWDVAGTTANGINTANVNILISTDAGATFTTLVANTPNDGTQTVTMPSVSAPYCRIMIESIGNIFYAVSKSFSLGYSVNTVVTCNNYTSSPGTTIAAQNPLTWQIVGQVAVPDNFVISDMNVSLNITHGKINDLYVGVLPPGATTVGQIRVLYQQGCPALVSSNMITTFDDAGVNLNCGGIAASNTYKPLNSLSFFNGLSSSGNWRIVALDVEPANNGTLNSFTFNICSSVTTVTLANDDFEIKDFVVYPNPNNGDFNVKFTSNSNEEIKIGIHDMRGREIFNKSFTNTGFIDQNLQLDDVQAGVYLVTVQDGNRKEVKKIVVE